MFEVLSTIDESPPQNDFVALGNIVENGSSAHSSMLVAYQNIFYVFHYLGDVRYDELADDVYYFKKTRCIVKDEVPAFIAHCKNIESKAQPGYGYFYSGEYYDSEGNFISPTGLREIMTCVGFCLNVLKGFLERDYVQFTDWESDSHAAENYVEGYCERHNLKIENIALSHRRITPLECLVSGFFSNLPIRKESIDSKAPEIEEYLRQI